MLHLFGFACALAGFGVKLTQRSDLGAKPFSDNQFTEAGRGVFEFFDEPTWVTHVTLFSTIAWG